MEFVQPIRDVKKIAAMKKVLKGQNLRDYCLFVLGINSGLRISDLLRLKVSDVMDEDGNVLARIERREKKTNKVKNFPLGDTSVKAIQEYLESKKLPLDSPLFPSRKGRGELPISRVQAYKILNEAAKTVGIKERIGTHTCRKTFAYHSYKNGIDIHHIQKALNHESPRTTLDYIGVTQDETDFLYMSLNL